MKQLKLSFLLVLLMSLMGIQTSGHTLEAASLNTDVTDGLVAYYPFNGNANDESGNGNDGTPTPSVTLTTGIHGDANGAYQFGGYDNPGCITVNNSQSLMFAEGCTFSVYVKPATWSGMDGYGSRNAEGLHCMFAKSSDRSGVSFTYSGNTERFHVFSHSFAQKWAEVDTEDKVNGDYLNKWIHVAFVYSSTHAKVYVNGKLICEKESTPDFSVMNQQNLNIGQYSSWYPMEGAMDELRIYNRALTDKEVKQLAQYADSNGTYPKSPRYLVVWDNNDAKTTYALKDKPQVTLADDAFVVTKDGQETSFLMGSTKRFTYERIMPGDINGDAKVDIVDVAMTINYLLSVTRSDFPVEAADLNKNGGVDSDDVTAMIDLVVNGPEAVAPAPVQQSRGNALYNYRNDGDFNAWLNIDVDSITYSRLDLDGIECDNVVTQEVWTPDSCFRIPIEAIDSIGFRAPETKYKEGVFFLNEEHEPYIRSIDDLNITFDRATPSHLLPSAGQVIVSETSYGILEEGFAGRAMSVSNTDDGIEFTCKEVSLSDIFEQIIYVSKCSSTEGLDPEAYHARSSRRRKFSYGIGIDDVIKIELDPVETPKKIDGEDMPIRFKYTPEMDITCLISVLKNHPAVAKVTFHHSHTLSLGMDYEKKFNPEPKEWWFSKKDIRIHIPVAAVDAVIKPYVNFGAFVDYNAKVKFEYELPLLKFEQTFGVDYSEYRNEEDRLQFFNETEFVHDDPTISLSIDGSLAFGLAMKIGAKLIHKRLLNFEAIFHIGPEFKGHFDLSTDRIGEDANLYRQLKTTTLDLYGYVAIPQATYQYVGSGVKLAKRGTWKGAKWSNHIVKTDDLLPNEWFPEGIMIDWPIRKWHLLPEFKQPEVYEANATAAVASVQPSRNLLFPVDVGVAFKDYSTGDVIEKNCGQYWGKKHNAESSYVQTFEDLTPSITYKVYPTVKFSGILSSLNIKMDAEPSVDYTVAGKLIVTPNNVTIKKGEEAEVIIFGAEGNLTSIDDDPTIAKSLGITYDHRTGQHITMRILGVSEGSTYITVLHRSNGSSCIVNVNVIDSDNPVTGITLSQTTLNLQEGDTRSLTATVLPEDADNKNVAWESSDEGVATVTADGLVTAVANGTCIITCSATDGSGVKAEVQVTVTSGTIPDPGNHEWVDLGLPSGTLWATCNVGASSPEEYGDYFAWGETTTKVRYNSNTYQYYDGSYVNIGSDIAGTQYDAATANWGAPWRMPSMAQIEELLNNTTSVWTTQNGVCGRKFTGSNGGTIFLPAAGYRWEGEFFGVGEWGYYWSSTPFLEDHAYGLGFDLRYAYWDNCRHSRYVGRSVRPVR